MVDPAAGIHGGNHKKKRCRPLRLGADVGKADHVIVQRVGDVEVSEHHALVTHATAGAAQVDAFFLLGLDN